MGQSQVTKSTEEIKGTSEMFYYWGVLNLLEFGKSYICQILFVIYAVDQFCVTFEWSEKSFVYNVFYSFCNFSVHKGMSIVICEKSRRK
jgi:hypothetical protein